MFLATGTVMRWNQTFALRQRSGADFTHRWFAFALLAVTIGHILMALARPESMRGILKGRVSAKWAHHEHPRWYAEVTEAGGVTEAGKVANVGAARVNVAQPTKSADGEHGSDTNGTDENGWERVGPSA